MATSTSTRGLSTPVEPVATEDPSTGSAEDSSTEAGAHEPATAEVGAAAASAALFQPETLTPTAPLTPGSELSPRVVGVAPPATPAVPAQWAADPSGRHQHRWWDGERWTEHVADNGASGVDRLG